MMSRGTRQRSEMSGVDRAAAMLLMLGEEYGTEVWAFLDEDEIRQVSGAMAQLGNVEPGVMDEILTEFAERLPQVSVMGDYERTEQLLMKLLPAEKAEQIMEELRGPAGRNMWQKMSNVQAAMLATYLKNEHPQTIALVLSRVNPKQTAQVLPLLPEALAVEVIDRMIHIETVPKTTLQSIEATLRQEFIATLSRSTGRNVYEQMAEVFNRVDKDTENRLLGALAQTRPAVAEGIRAMMFVFEDLADLDPPAIQTVIRQADPTTLAKALKGTSGRVRQAFMMNMSRRAGKRLSDEIDALGPLRLKQVEEAQLEVMNLTRTLERNGEITVAGRDEADQLVM
ncbi:flagellar motor switch protein FliG [Alsobacter sp. R-9]